MVIRDVYQNSALVPAPSTQMDRAYCTPCALIHMRQGSTADPQSLAGCRKQQEQR